MSENPVAFPRSAEELFEPDSGRPDGTEKFVNKPQNAADLKSLKKKAIDEVAARLKEENDLRAVLGTQEGVRFVARLVLACGWNMPHFNPSNSVMSEIAGRRAIAWQLENWISDVDLSLWFAVRQELEASRPKPQTSEKSGRRSS